MPTSITHSIPRVSVTRHRRRPPRNASQAIALRDSSDLAMRSSARLPSADSTRLQRNAKTRAINCALSTSLKYTSWARPT